MIYFLSVVSIFPRCGAGAAMLDAATPAEALVHFALAFADCLVAIVSESYLSLAMVIATFVIVLGFARTGGVGAAPAAAGGARAAAVAAARRRGAAGGGMVGVESGANGGSPKRGGSVSGSGSGGAFVGSEVVIGPLVKLRTGGLLMQVG